MTDEQKAREQAKIMFPDNMNIFARGNIEAEKVYLACINMAKWKEKTMIDKFIKLLKDKFLNESISQKEIEWNREWIDEIEEELKK